MVTHPAPPGGYIDQERLGQFIKVATSIPEPLRKVIETCDSLRHLFYEEPVGRELIQSVINLLPGGEKKDACDILDWTNLIVGKASAGEKVGIPQHEAQKLSFAVDKAMKCVCKELGRG